MRRKSFRFVEPFAKLFIFALCATIISMLLVAIGSKTILKELFFDMFFYSMMSFVGLFFISIFLLLIFSDYQTSYTADLENVPEEFERIYKIKKRVKRTAIWGKVLLGVFILFPMALKASVIFPIISLIILLIGFSSFIGMITLYNKNRIYKKEYAEIYKKEVIGNLVKLMYPELRFEAENSNKIDEYKNRYLEANYLNLDEFKAEDYIEGMIDNCPVKISDVVVKIAHVKYQTVFEGMFAFVDYTKFKMPNLVVSKKYAFSGGGKNYVKVDNELFNKYFDLYAQDELYAKILLRDGLDKKLLELRLKYNIDFDVSFVNGKIYIKIYSFSVFEPEIFDKTNGKQDLYTHYCFVKFILDLIKEVKIIVDKN